MSDEKTPKRRFVRVYYVDLQRDYPEVWFDPTCLSTWIRLLALADQAWPAQAELPKAVRRLDLEALQRVGLVTMIDNNRYAMKGYESERFDRSEKARQSANARYGRRATAERPQSDRTATHAPASDTGSSDTGSSGVGSGEGFANISRDAQVFLEGVTGRTIRQAGDRNLNEYDRQIGEHGLDAVIGAIHRAAKALPPSPKPQARQLIWGARSVLEPFADTKAIAAADTSEADAKRAAKRDEGIWKRRIDAYRHGGSWDEAWGEPPA